MNPNIEPLERRRLLALAGDIDPTFAPQTYALADHLVPMGNDQFLVLGAQSLQKINASGTPDASFSLNSGFQGSRVPEEIEDALIQHDGKIVLAGFPPPLNLPGVVARFNADGTLDTAFADNGVFDPSKINPRYSVESAALAPDGKMVLDVQQVPEGDSFGGNDPFDTGDQTLHVIRLNTDGSVDTSFATFSFTNHFLATPALVVDSQDRVLIGGNVAFGSTDSVSIVRLRDGSLDTSFGGGDGAIAEIPTRAIALLPGGNGAFVAVDDNSNVRQFSAAGAADTSFGTAGVATTGIQSSAAVEFPQILPAPGGKWLLFNEQWMTRLNADGSQDSTFPPISDPTDAKEFTAAANDAAGNVLVLRHIVGTDGDELARLLGAPDANISTPITLSGSTLSITGTVDSDVIQVLASGDQLRASVGALARLFDQSGIDLISIQAGAGNDFVQDSSAVPAAVSGGDGADTIIGGDGADSLSGNAGRDKIWGGAGNDRVAGNGGRDRLDGGPGDDRVYGGAGGDWIDSDGGGDLLAGQDGNDIISDHSGSATISGGDGDDTIFAANGAAQSIFGDAGNDSASHDPNDILNGIENDITA